MWNIWVNNILSKQNLIWISHSALCHQTTIDVKTEYKHLNRFKHALVCIMWKWAVSVVIKCSLPFLKYIVKIIIGSISCASSVFLCVCERERERERERDCEF